MLSKEARVMETLFNIQDKQGITVPFILNPSQRAYDNVKTRRDIIPKARQKGFSMYKVGEHVARCLGIPGTRAVVISHEASATQRLLDRAQFMLKHINGPKPMLGRNSRNELYFPKTESTYYIGTAGARAFGRGDTITDLHISEYAWWESDVKHIAGLMQAVPMTGSISIESTGNGQGNDFYYMCKNAKKLGYNLFFRSWWEDDEYSIQAPEGWIASGYEHIFEEMREKYTFLTENQLFWYYNKLLEFRGDIRLLRQEYPTVLDECFQATGHSLYTTIPFEPTNQYIENFFEGYRMSSLKGHPIPNHTYIIGADPSGGTFNDDAAIEIIDLDLLEEVLSFNSNSIDPVLFTDLIIKLGILYNEAYVVPEANNHGAAVIPILRRQYNPLKIYKRNIPIKSTGRIPYGFINNETSKHEAHGALLQAIELGLVIHNEDTKAELETVQEIEGIMGAKKDNLWMALCFASLGIRKWYRLRKVEEEPTVAPVKQPSKFVITFDDIFKDKNVKSAFTYEKKLPLPIRR